MCTSFQSRETKIWSCLKNYRQCGCNRIMKDTTSSIPCNQSPFLFSDVKTIGFAKQITYILPNESNLFIVCLELMNPAYGCNPPSNRNHLPSTTSFFPSGSPHPPCPHHNNPPIMLQHHPPQYNFMNPLHFPGQHQSQPAPVLPISKSSHKEDAFGLPKLHRAFAKSLKWTSTKKSPLLVFLEEGNKGKNLVGREI